MFNDIFKSEKCDCCNGTGKSFNHSFKRDEEEVRIIRKTFPKFNPEKSCNSCFGDGEIMGITKNVVSHELSRHMQDKICEESMRRRRRD